ncbi:hypothetical protein [Pseudofrankia sp. BMG5.36]|uniref:hypothetical protein n=1 Tax=Pseudofrankia sp. BMG5.36 TaxID=1834512 RepID=UPI0008D9BC0B|nr:hypothetical protein [Pseudofrankia sp. BMG5.36]OHV54230.1 hypothetical protein BCD48_09080 [Pseudofrankia sp. BMG5.36]
MLTGIRVAVFDAGCAELGSVLARPREASILSGPMLGAAGAGGFWRGTDAAGASAARGGTDVSTLTFVSMADMPPAEAPMAYALADEARLDVVPAVKPIVVPADRHAASVAAPSARDKSAFKTAAIAHTNQLQAKTQAFTRRHPRSRGPSQTEPPV